jgi:hypothetical protein
MVAGQQLLATGTIMMGLYEIASLSRAVGTISTIIFLHDMIESPNDTYFAGRAVVSRSEKTWFELFPEVEYLSPHHLTPWGAL